ncbi:unnamed protein product [Closterium sp. NIES-54]
MRPHPATAAALLCSCCRGPTLQLLLRPRRHRRRAPTVPPPAERQPFPPLVSTCLPACLPAYLPACRTYSARAAAATTTTGVGQMQLQRRPRESLTPQQLREWYTGWGCRGGRAATAATAAIAATAATEATIATAATGGGQMQLQRRPRESLTPRQLREWYAQSRGSLSTVRCPYVIRTGDRTVQACGTLIHTQSRCFARLSNAWRNEFGDEAELPTWLELLGQGVDIYALDYDAILIAMYALPTSANRACYLCAAASGAGESALSGTAPAEALYTFTLDAGASRSFFRDSTTLTPLSRSVPVSLADPSGGPVRATSSIVHLSCCPVRDSTADKLSACAVPYVFLGFVPDAPGWQFYHPTSRRVFPSQDVTFDESVPFYRLFPYRTAPLPPPRRSSPVSVPSVSLVASASRTDDTLAPALSSCSLVTSSSVPDLGDVTFDESVPFYRLFPYRTAPLPPPPLFLTPGAPQVDPLPAPGPSQGVSQVDPPPLTAPVEVTGDSGPAEGGRAQGTTSGGAEPGGAEPGGAEPGGAEPGGAEPRGAEPRGAEPGGAETGGAEPGREGSGGAEPGGTESGGAAPGGAEASGEQSPWDGRLHSRSAGTSLLHSRPRGPAAGGAGAGVSATGVVSAGGSGAAEGAGVGGSGAAAGAGAGGSGAAAGAGAEGFESAVARSPWSSRLRPRVPLTSQQLHDWYGRRQGRASGARGSTAGGTSAGVTGAGSGAGPGGARTGGTGAAGARGAEPGGAPAGDPGSGGAATGDTETGDPRPGGAGSGGVATGGAGPGRAGAEGSGAAGGAGAAGAAGAGGAAQPRLFFAPPSPSSQPPSDSVPHQRIPLPSPPASSLPTIPEPKSNHTRAAHSTLTRLLATVVTDPSFEFAPASALVIDFVDFAAACRLNYAASLVAESESLCPPSVGGECALGTDILAALTRLLATVVTDPSFEFAPASALVTDFVDFAAACRLDYAASLVAEFESLCPPSVGGECALGTDVLEDMQEDLECLAAAAPHLVSMLLAPEGDPDAPDIPQAQHPQTPQPHAQHPQAPHSQAQQPQTQHLQTQHHCSTLVYSDLNRHSPGEWVYLRYT